MIEDSYIELYDSLNDYEKNCFKKIALDSEFACVNIIPLRPDIGRYINVNGLEISERFFPDEFTEIVNIYDTLIKKLNKFNRNVEYI